MAASLPSEPAVELSLTDPKHNVSLSWENGSLQKSHSAKEKHVAAGDVIRDIIIGFADGLTVPFALTAGLSSLGSSRLVIVGGLAELVSGAISMGLGAYLAAATERDHYLSEEKRERHEVATMPEAEKQEIYDIFAGYGIDRAACKGVVDSLAQDEESWVRVRFHSLF
jgi:vacuolar iron transporter family protein